MCFSSLIFQYYSFFHRVSFLPPLSNFLFLLLCLVSVFLCPLFSSAFFPWFWVWWCLLLAVRRCAGVSDGLRQSVPFGEPADRHFLGLKVFGPGGFLMKIFSFLFLSFKDAAAQPPGSVLWGSCNRLCCYSFLRGFLSFSSVLFNISCMVILFLLYQWYLACFLLSDFISFSVLHFSCSVLSPPFLFFPPYLVMSFLFPSFFSCFLFPLYLSICFHFLFLLLFQKICSLTLNYPSCILSMNNAVFCKIRWYAIFSSYSFCSWLGIHFCNTFTLLFFCL